MPENVLITGGGGFIGRAILKWMPHHWPLARYTVYGRNPIRLQRVRERFGADAIIGDILDADRLSVMMSGADTVIHAAAMKHIPEGERYPSECFRVNVEGSRNVILAAIENRVRDLILISTDKACEPANAYGLSKAMMERIAVEYAQRQSVTAIHIVRYGNVVGSTGSVIPLFQSQAARGEQLTVTDPHMTRFWLSPSMAVAVIARGINMPSGAIYVPKLGSMMMDELAVAVAVGHDVGFDVIGARPGEKQHEMLMTLAEGRRAIRIETGYQIYPVGSERSIANGGHEYTSEDAGVFGVSIELATMRAWIEEGAGV